MLYVCLSRPVLAELLGQLTSPESSAPGLAAWGAGAAQAADVQGRTTSALQAQGTVPLPTVPRGRECLCRSANGELWMLFVLFVPSLSYLLTFLWDSCCYLLPVKYFSHVLRILVSCVFYLDANNDGPYKYRLGLVLLPTESHQYRCSVWRGYQCSQKQNSELPSLISLLYLGCIIGKIRIEKYPFLYERWGIIHGRPKHDKRRHEEGTAGQKQATNCLRTIENCLHWEVSLARGSSWVLF